MVFHSNRDLAWHPRNSGNAIAPFTHGSLGATERCVAGVRVHVLPSTIVGGEEHECILLETQCTDLIHDVANTRINLHDGIGELALGQPNMPDPTTSTDPWRLSARSIRGRQGLPTHAVTGAAAR